MIRDSTPQDAPEILGLTREFFTADEVDCVQDIIDVFLNEPGQKDYVLLTAEQDGQMTGYACYGPTAITQGNYSLFWMCVRPGDRHRGVGTELLSEIERRIRPTGRLLLAETSSTPDYVAARTFYQKHGFTQWTVVPDFYRPGDGLVLYVKYLDGQPRTAPQ